MVNGSFQKQSNSNFEKTISKTKESPINHIHNNEISTWDKESNEEETKEKIYDASSESKERNPSQTKTKPQPTFSLTKNNNKHKVHKRQQSNPKFQGKQDYLLWVNAQDCTKDKITGLYSITDKHIPPENNPNQTKPLMKKQKIKQRRKEKEQNNKQTGPQIGKIVKRKTMIS